MRVCNVDQRTGNGRLVEDFSKPGDFKTFYPGGKKKLTISVFAKNVGLR